MSEALSLRHPLAQYLMSSALEPVGPSSVTVEVRAGLHHINLRGDARDARFLGAAEAILGDSLPTIANTMTTGVFSTYWLGPDEWLITAGSESGSKLLSDFDRSLAELYASVNDLSGGQLALRLSGPDALEVLAKGCTLDFDSRAFPAGRCAQTGLGKAGILIGRGSSDSVYDIIVRRSFAEYVALWLSNAGAEFGIHFSEDAQPAVCV